MVDPSGPKPQVSVVVATRNRAHLLPRLVAALEAQQGAAPFEAVFVDDASTDDTPAVLAGLASAASFPLRTLRLDRNRGPAAARNAGWRMAAGDVVAFTDDDCEPQPGWLAALAAALDFVDIAQGCTQPAPDQPYLGWFSRAPQNDDERGLYETCNIAYRRATLASVEGFDERFGPTTSFRGRASVAPVWGEDTDLAWRAKERGARTTFVVEAIVWHDLKPGRFRDELADLRRRGTAAYLVKRHPGVRMSYDSPWFVQAAHRPALLATAALGAVLMNPRRPLAWALAGSCVAAWARHRSVYFPPRLWFRTLPQWFVVDVADVSVMALASIRHRTLLL